MCAFVPFFQPLTLDHLLTHTQAVHEKAGTIRTTLLPSKSFRARLDHEAVTLLQPAGSSEIDTLDLGGLAEFLEVALAEGHVLVLEALQTAVLAGELDAHGDTHYGGNNLQGDTDAQGESVMGLVLRAVCEGRPDTGRVADRVDECVRGGTFGRWAGDGACDPGVARPVHREDEGH